MAGLLLVLLLFVRFARVARAEQAVTTAATSFRAPATCPSEAWFARQIAARTARLRLIPSGSPADLHLTITLSEERDRFSGEVRLQKAGSIETASRLSAMRCEQVVAGLALMIALTVDPNAEPGAEEATDSGSHPPIPASLPADASRAIDLTPRILPRILPKWTVVVGARGGLRTAVGPDAAPGASLTVGLRGQQGPSVELALGGSFAPPSSEQLSTIHWSLATLRLSLCPVSLGDRLFFKGCGSFEGGFRSARRDSAPADVSSTRAWLAPGLSVLGGVLIGAGVELQLQAAGLVPLLRDRFLLSGTRVIYDTPMMSIEAALGAAFHFS